MPAGADLKRSWHSEEYFRFNPESNLIRSRI
jgi:hypothetical protein